MRYTGIQHRVKKTRDGEARPTRVAVLLNSVFTKYELETETDELDYLLGRFVTKYRKAVPGDDLTTFHAHQIKWKELKKGEDLTAYPQELIRKIDGAQCLAREVPAVYDGFKKDDVVGMVLGGSGDKLGFALSRRAEELGGATRVMRIPSFTLKDERGNADKDVDSELFATLAETKAHLFQTITPRERELIREREALQARIEAMKARIGCDQRLLTAYLGKVFCNPEGKYPEGSVQEAYDDMKANDAIFGALSKEEEAREKELKKIIEALDIYQELFAPIEGCGPLIAARLIGAIVDIRRFDSQSRLKHFCGVHVADGGRFVRRRTGEVANWHPDARQALYLLADQWNRRPESHWGKVWRAYKKVFRERHPEVVETEGGKKRYTDGHIHKMAMWRTITKFVEWLWAAWWKIEVRHGATRPTKGRMPFVPVVHPTTSATEFEQMSA